MVFDRHTLKLGSQPTALAVALTLLCLQSCGDSEGSPSKEQLREDQRVITVPLEATAPLREADKLNFIGNVPIPNKAEIWPVEGCKPFVRPAAWLHLRLLQQRRDRASVRHAWH